jgi:hypothetical protein
MTDHLNSGPGECQVVKRLTLSITEPVLHLGSGPDVFNIICSALHAWNRHAAPGDYLAIAFPHLSPENDKSKGKFGFLVFGADIEIYGSEKATQAFMSGSEMVKLQRRSMISCEEDDVSGIQGSGVAFIRERKSEKATEGYLRRLQRRDARHGKTSTTPPVKALKSIRKETHKGFLTAKKGFRVNFFAKNGDVSQVVRVSTYGLSSSLSPAFLPCAHPGSLRDLEEMGLNLDAM